MLEIFGTSLVFANTCEYTTIYNNEIVFQSSSIDVLPLKRTSTDFTLSKNNEKPKLPGNSRTETHIGGPE